MLRRLLPLWLLCVSAVLGLLITADLATADDADENDEAVASASDGSVLPQQFFVQKKDAKAKTDPKAKAKAKAKADPKAKAKVDPKAKAKAKVDPKAKAKKADPKAKAKKGKAKAEDEDELEEVPIQARSLEPTRLEALASRERPSLERAVPRL